MTLSFELMMMTEVEGCQFEAICIPFVLEVGIASSASCIDIPSLLQGKFEILLIDSEMLCFPLECLL